MKRVINICLTILLLSTFACNRDSDILATNKIKNITRLDFNNWISAKGYSTEKLLKEKDSQIQKLSEMAIELCCLKKAKIEGYDRNPDFQKIKGRITEKVLYRWYVKEIRKNLKFNENAIKVKNILFPIIRFKTDPNTNNKKILLTKSEIEKKYAELTKKANEVIQRLNSGEDFEDLYEKYCNNSKCTDENNDNYFIYEMKPSDYSEPVSKLKKNEYTKKPVKTTRGIYIVKVTDIINVTEKNVEDIFNDEKLAAHIRSRFTWKFIKQYIDKLKAANDVYFYDQKSSGKQNDIIFKIGGRIFTVADLDRQLERRMSEVDKEVVEKNVSQVEMREKFAENIFQYEIWKRDALKLKIDKKQGYSEDLRQNVESALAGQYFKHLADKSISITDLDIRNEYEKNKKEKYYRIITVKGKKYKKPKPFEEVKSVIANKLKALRMDDLMDKLLDEIDFKIDESQLEGD